MVQTYAERNSVLRGLGYPSYAAYLASDLWREVRARAYREIGSVCKLCARPAQVVHHLSYSQEVLTGRDIRSGLAPLCNRCHERVERTPEGRKRSLRGAQEQYERLCKLYRRGGPGAGRGKIVLKGVCKVCGYASRYGRGILCRPCSERSIGIG